VAVELRDGRRFARTQETPRGSDHNFAADGDIVAKFEKLAGHALPPKRVAELRDAVLGLEKLRDAAKLGELLAR